MAEVLTSLVKDHWMLILGVLFGLMMFCVYMAMSLTSRMERRRREQFEREFTGRFQAVSLKKEK